MTGSVIVVDSSPEPEHIVLRSQAAPSMVHHHGMEAQAHGGLSLKDKGKQKAPAPIVYEISSDDSHSPPAHEEDDSEVQFTGMRSPGTTAGEHSTADLKRKREAAFEASDSPTGSRPDLWSAPSAWGTAFVAGVSAPYSMPDTSSYNFESSIPVASTSAAASSSTSTSGINTNTNTNTVAGPSGHASASLKSPLGPVVKKARLETDSAAAVAPTESTATIPTTAGAPPVAPAGGLITPLNHATVDPVTLRDAYDMLARPPYNVRLDPVDPAHPPANHAVPPAANDGAALQPGAPSQHGAINPGAPPAANAQNVPNNAVHVPANHAPNNPNNGPVAYMRQMPWMPGQNTVGQNAAGQNAAGRNEVGPHTVGQHVVDANAIRPYVPARLAAHRVELERERNLATLRNGAVDADAPQRDLRAQALRRELDEVLARNQENIRRTLERAGERERQWQRMLQLHRLRQADLERQIEQQRRLERQMRLMEPLRERRAHDNLARPDVGVGGQAGGAGLGQGLGVGRAGALFNRNRHRPVRVDDANGPPPLLDFGIFDDELDLEGPINAALGDAVQALNAVNPNNANGGADVGLQNQFNGIRADLVDLDNNLGDIGNGIAQVRGDLEDAMEDFDELLQNAAENVHNDNLGAGNAVHGPYANPLFAPPVAAPPAPAGNQPAQAAVVVGANRAAEGGGRPAVGEDDNDIYAPVREAVRTPPPDPFFRLVAAPQAPPAANAEPVPTGATLTNAAAAAFARPATLQRYRAGAVPQPVAGPSRTAAPVINVDALQQGPAPHAAAHPPAAGPSTAAGASGSNNVPTRPVDPIDTILASILEVVPDVLPEHATTLARTHFPSFGVMHTADHVLGLLFESKDYPRRGKVKGKGKNKAKEETEVVQTEKDEEDDDDTGADFLNAKMKGQPGRNYKRLAMFHLRQAFPHAGASQLATASSMRYARGHAFLAERLGVAPLPVNAHNADGGFRAHRHRPRLGQVRAQPYGVGARPGHSAANNAMAGGDIPGNHNAWNDEPWGARMDNRANNAWDNTAWNTGMDPRMEEERAALRGVVDKEFAKERRWVERRYGLPKSHLGTGDTAAAAEGAAGSVNGPREDTGMGKGKGKDNGKGKGKAKEVALADEEEEPVEEGMGVECQCCFAEYSFSRMAQCPEAHLFCVSCISQYAAVQLGNMNPSLVCMHADGCAMPFGELELRRVLTRKLMRLYERVLSQKAVEGLEGLEACPFCEWKCVMDVSPEVDRLFRCGNVRSEDDDDEEQDEDECGVVSCRLCKKVDHTPKSCQEAEEDKHLDGQHAVEEAMTAALMRNCPKCKKAFIKEGGCNKMTCPYCGTHSCYTCRKQITGYDHFDQRPLDPGEPVAPGKCRTHDTRQLEEIHANEVKAAAEKALAEYKAAHPDAEDGQIKVDIPEAPPALPRNPPRHHQNRNMLGHRQRMADLAQLNNQLALLAAQMAPLPHARIANGAGNAQPAAAPAGPAPPAPIPRQIHQAYYPPLQRIGYGADHRAHFVAAQAQRQNEQLHQDIVMADAPPLNNQNQLLGQRAAAAPQPHVPAPAAAPYPYHLANGFMPRLIGLAAPQQPQQPQPPPQPVAPPVHPMDHHDAFLRRAQQTRLALDALVNEHRNPMARPVRQAPPNQMNAIAGPAYPIIRGPADHAAMQQQLRVPPPIPLPAPAPAGFPPVPNPAVNAPHQAGVGQGDFMGMGFGMGFDPGMDVDMGMGFGVGMGEGLNMGMHMGGGNNANRPPNLPQGQGDAARDAGNHYMRPF